MKLNEDGQEQEWLMNSRREQWLTLLLWCSKAWIYILSRIHARSSNHCKAQDFSSTSVPAVSFPRCPHEAKGKSLLFCVAAARKVLIDDPQPVFLLFCPVGLTPMLKLGRK